MANIKITDLTAYTDPLNTDVLPIVDVTSDTTKKVSIADLLKNASAGTAAAPGIAFDGDPNTGIYSPGADQLAISTGGTGRLFVDNAGRVGLGGASSPVDDLHISTTNPSIVLEESDAGTNAKYWRTRVDNNAYIFEGLTDAFNNPSFWLRAFRATNSEQIDNIQFATSGSERLRIDSSGRLLVGTPSASVDARVVLQAHSGSSTQDGKLYIQRGATSLGNNTRTGQINFADSASNVGAAIESWTDDAWASGDYPGRLVFSTTADSASSPTERMRISANGRFNCQGIYSFTTASAANVFVASDGNVVRSTSSSKYKTQVEAADYHYSEALLGCEPVWYRSTCAGDNPEWGWWGFIAEDVAKIDPRLVHWKTVQVTHDENGAAVQSPCDPEPEGVAYDRFVPHLLNLVKRQKEQIETMEARLSALEAS